MRLRRWLLWLADCLTRLALWLVPLNPETEEAPPILRAAVRVAVLRASPLQQTGAFKRVLVYKAIRQRFTADAVPDKVLNLEIERMVQTL